MRLIGFIMAFIVLGLSCMPCNDTFAASEKATIKLVEKSNPVNDSPDDCSPLCQCQCCAAPFVQLATETPDLNILPETMSHHSYYNKATSSMPFNIWQPPQLNR